MAAEGVEDVRDFKWESQLRYYWELHDAPPSGVRPQVRLAGSNLWWLALLLLDVCSMLTLT